MTPAAVPVPAQAPAQAQAPAPVPAQVPVPAVTMEVRRKSTRRRKKMKIGEWIISMWKELTITGEATESNNFILSGRGKLHQNSFTDNSAIM